MTAAEIVTALDAALAVADDLGLPVFPCRAESDRQHRTDSRSFAE